MKQEPVKLSLEQRQQLMKMRQAKPPKDRVDRSYCKHDIAPEEEARLRSLSRFSPNRAAGNRPGWVYVVRIVGGPTKIGLTFDDDPTKRMQRIDYGVPYPTVAVALGWSKDAAWLEQKLHSEFHDKRIKGEWFDLDSEDVEKILENVDFGPPNEMIARWQRSVMESIKAKMAAVLVPDEFR